MNQSRSMGKLITTYYNLAGQIHRDQVELACDVLRKGGVIAVPTDTIYGIAARVDDSKALNRIYQIKGRDTTKPLSVCLSSLEDIDQVSDQKISKQVLRSLLPGPITILLNRRSDLNEDLNPNIDTIGVRVPNHNFITAVANMIGPLALTSANKSGESSPIEVGEFQELWPELDYIFDCGLLQKHNIDDNPMITRLGSTVVDLSKPLQYKIVRKGCALNRTVNLLRRFGFKEDTTCKEERGF